MIVNESKESASGVFWVIDGELYAFPFYEDNLIMNGVAKSGTTYNHQKLWDEVKPRKCNKLYNYYPRGRVDITPSGIAVVYINPHITDEVIHEVIKEFGVSSLPVRIHRDYSDHYKCYLDKEI